MKTRTQHRIQALTSPRSLLIVGTAALLLVITLALSAQHAQTSTPEEVTSGPLDVTTTLDTTPFTPAAGNTGGPTTIPEGFFESTTTTPTLPTEPVGTTAPSTPTTTAPPPTTTTTLPVPSRQSDPICQAFVDIITMQRSGIASVSRDPAAYAVRLSKRLDGWIVTLRAINAQTYGGAISKLEQMVAKLDDRPSFDEIRVVLDDLMAPDPRTKPLVDYAMATCPAVLAAR